jgi:hypothetical protein
VENNGDTAPVQMFNLELRIFTMKMDEKLGVSIPGTCASFSLTWSSPVKYPVKRSNI